MKSLSTLLNSRAYYIPKNQRGYSWTPKEIDDLFSDIELMGTKSHYLGTIICSKSDSFIDEISGAANIKYILEDGQQRLTTFVIIVNEIKKRFIEIDGNETIESRELDRLISYKNDGLKLRIENENHTINDYFRHVIQDLKLVIPESKAPLMGKLKKAADHIQSKLNLIQDRESLLRLKNKVCNQVLIIDVDLSDAMVDRYLTFDAINSRGLPLTEFDKIKNFCILVCERRKLEIRPEDEWYQAISNLEMFKVGSRSHENSFIAELFSLYHNVSASNSDVHEKFVKEYRILLDGENKKKEIKISGFINLLSTYSKSYGLVNTTDKKNFVGELCDKDAYNWLTNIDRLGLSGITKRILATSHYSFEFHEFSRIAQVCEIYTFRMHALSRYRVDKCTKDIMTLSHQILCNEYAPQEVVRQLSKLLVNNSKITDSVGKLCSGELTYTNWSYLYYFLFEYEKSKSAYPTLDWERNENLKRESIEHILPQNCDEWWSEHWPDQLQAEKWTHRVGNLVLSKGNSILGRKSIAKKMKDLSCNYYYSHDSATSCEKQLSKFTDGSVWQHREILLREIDMVNFALKRWSIPCIQDVGIIKLNDEFTRYLPKCDNIVVTVDDGVDIFENNNNIDFDDIVID